MRGETEWTGFQTIHFPLRKIHMDSFRIFSTFGFIFYKIKKACLHLISVNRKLRWNSGENYFFLWKIIFFFLSLFSVVYPEWFIPDEFPTFLVVPDPEANFKKARSNSGEFHVHILHCTLQKHLGQSSWRLKLLDENGSDPLRYLWNLVHKLLGFARKGKIQNIRSLWPLVIEAVQILKITVTFLFLKISRNSKDIKQTILIFYLHFLEKPDVESFFLRVMFSYPGSKHLQNSFILADL